eukprot:PITA_27488
MEMSSVYKPVLISESDIKVGELIKLGPSKPTPTGTLFLSNIDLTVIFPVETIYFFEPPPAYKPSTDDVVEKMKGWFSDILVPYHFLGARLQVNPGNGRLELNCNRSEALFTGASSELTLMQLGDLSRPNPSFRNLIVKTDDIKELSDTPLITMQVTRFKCGGFCVGLVTYHCLMDGVSAIEFLHNLASIARGEGLVTEPKFDRTSLKARIPPHINHQHHEFIEIQENLASSSMTAFTASDTEIHSVKNISENQSHRLFNFSVEMLKRLKQEAMKDNIIRGCSTFEVMVAHLWQARTKAVFQNPTQKSTVLFAVDIRSKVNPPLPKGFVGNGVVTAYATASVREVKENPLSYCVAEIQKAIASMTDDYIRSSIDWLEVHRGIPAAINGNFFLSAWWKLPFYEFDLGWGKPVYAGPIVSGMAEFVLLIANGSQEGINAWIILEPHQMEKFEVLVNEI